jgi:hypothetical protein
MATKKKSQPTKKKASAKTAAKPKKKAAPKKAAPKKAAPKKVAKTKAAAPKKAAPKKVAKTKTAAPKKVTKTKAAASKKVAPISRRDGTGHLNPKMAADLRRRSKADRIDNGNAFLRGTRSEDDLAEALGEEAVTAMTGGDDVGEDLNELQEEELGGPFVTSTGKKEYGRGVDASNPKDAEREPFPKT